ncbi:MAG: hypothetical protein VX589_03605 [Myxococcota bacterium]|nr:hypothetical protein [Myxococcota bacterium]
MTTSLRYPIAALCFLIGLSGCDDGPATDAAPPDGAHSTPLGGAARDQENGPSMVTADSPLTQLVHRAGSADSDIDRYAILREAEVMIDAQSEQGATYRAMMDFLDRWTLGRANHWTPGDQEQSGEAGYLAGFFNGQVWPGQTDIPVNVSESSIFYPLWCFYRGRMLVWTAIQSGFLTDVYFEEARRLLGIAREAFPDNDVIRMYLDEPTEWPVPFAAAPDVPDWANHQRIALFKLNEVVQYWIDFRQAPDGQFGGGWGDDVEMWRWWSPILLGFESPALVDAQTKLADGIFALERMRDGFSSILTDVEHSAEDSSDTITPMLLLDPNNPVWQARARQVGALMSSRWQSENAAGRIQFTSSYLSSEGAGTAPENACDTPYHARVTQPLLALWLQTKDVSVGDLLIPWLNTWVWATATEDNGKPAQVMPAAISYPSANLRGPNSKWWDPGCHLNPATFRFPRAQKLMLTTLAVAAALTGTPTLLAPIRTAYEMAGSGDSKAQAGTLAWAIAETEGDWITGASKYRQLTGDQAFDEGLRRAGTAYVKSQLTDDMGAVDEALAKLVDELAYDRAAHTTEVRYTDRVFKFHRRYANLYRSTPTGRIDTNLIYQMVTGDWTRPDYGARPAVRWLISPLDVAIRVIDGGVERFEADIVHFVDRASPFRLKLFRLRRGPLVWTLTSTSGERRTGVLEASDTEPILDLTPMMRGQYRLVVESRP